MLDQLSIFDKGFVNVVLLVLRCALIVKWLG